MKLSEEEKVLREDDPDFTTGIRLQKLSPEEKRRWEETQKKYGIPDYPIPEFLKRQVD